MSESYNPNETHVVVPYGQPHVNIAFENVDGSQSIYSIRESDMRKIWDARSTLKALELFLRMGGHEDEAVQVASVFESLD